MSRDTVFRIYVNPTPRIEVVVDNDTICDGGTSTIGVSSPVGLTAGAVLFDYTIEDTSGPATDISGQTTGIGESLGDILQTLDNHTNQTQWVEYRIHPYAVNTGSGVDCDYGASLDTTFRIYVNPTPQIIVDAPDIVLCNDEVVNFSITNPNGVVWGDWKYNLTVDYGVHITGLNVGGEYTDIDLSILDQLVNNDTAAHVVSYHFSPLITSMMEDWIVVQARIQQFTSG